MAKSDNLERYAEALQSADIRARRKAVERIARFRDERAFGLLWQVMEDSHWSMRWRALMGIARSFPQHPDTVPLLERSLRQDPNAEVRLHAARALINYRTEETAAALCAALHDSKKKVRTEVGEAIRQLGVVAVGPLCAEIERTVVAVTLLQQMATVYKRELPLRILVATGLTGYERWRGLVAVRGVGGGWFSMPVLPDVRRFCEETLARGPEAAQAGARAVLDYMTLARPSDRDLSQDKDVLLRAAEGGESAVNPATLLRASHAETEDEQNVDAKPPSRLRLSLRKVWLRVTRGY